MLLVSGGAASEERASSKDGRASRGSTRAALLRSSPLPLPNTYSQPRNPKQNGSKLEKPVDDKSSQP